MKRVRLTETLLPERHTLQLLEPILLGRAVDDRVLEQVAVHTMVVDGRLDGAATAVGGDGLELPRVAALVVHEARVVVALVEELEHGREDLGLLVGQGEALCLGFHELAAEGVLEER